MADVPSFPTANSVARLPLTSLDPAASRYEELKALFPDAVTDGRINWEKLRAVLGEAAATGRERYGLSWAGKSDALKVLRQLTTATLLPAPSESEKWDTTGNTIIEGDNLEVLKTLQHAYHGKVKLIYIDPPYNTGGDFIYPDDYSEGLASYQLFTRQVSEEGHKLTTNVNTSGRYHSRWLTMMYPRLYLARNLLREDGVIFVSIDDHEVHNLRLVMDEIFGEENFIANIVWQKRYVSNVTAKHVSDMHDYVVVYGRRSEKVKFNLTPRTESQLEDYKNPDSDPRGSWRTQDLSASKPYQAGLFEITGPTGKKFTPPPGRYWRCNQETFNEWRRDNRIWFGKDGSGRPMLKAFLDEVQAGLTPHTWWAHEFAGHNKEATLEMKKLFEGESPFDTPKPAKLVRRILELAGDSEGIVLDFFAGSGTTGEALLELNKEDGGNRKFILVQLPESTGRKDFPTIAEITKERVRRVIQRIEKERADQLALADVKAQPDLGFKVFKLAPSNFAIWDPSLARSRPDELAEQWQLTADNVRPGAQEQALLYELMLKCGLPLSSPIETADAAGCTAYRLDEGRFVICLARELNSEVLRAMIALQPQSLLCLDVGFKGNDALKVNAQLECQSHGVQFRTV